MSTDPKKKPYRLKYILRELKPQKREIDDRTHFHKPRLPHPPVSKVEIPLRPGVVPMQMEDLDRLILERGQRYLHGGVRHRNH